MRKVIDGLTPYFLLMRVHQPIGYVLLACPVWVSLWLASAGNPSWAYLFLFTMGCLVTRSLGCVINDFWDRDIDGSVKRTQNRMLAQSRLKSWQVVLLVALLAILGILLAAFLPPRTWEIIFLAAVGILLYPLSKRYIKAPQFILGLVFNLGVLIVWKTYQPHLTQPAWVIYSSSVIWSIAYDSIYAWQDKSDDQRLGLYSTALLFGNYFRQVVAGLLIMTWLFWCSLLKFLPRSWPMYLMLVMVLFLFFISVYFCQRDSKGIFRVQAWAGVFWFLGVWASYHWP